MMKHHHLSVTWSGRERRGSLFAAFQISCTCNDSLSPPRSCSWLRSKFKFGRPRSFGRLGAPAGGLPSAESNSSAQCLNLAVCLSL